MTVDSTIVSAALPLRKADFAMPGVLLLVFRADLSKPLPLAQRKSVLPDSQSIEAFPSWQQTDRNALAHQRNSC